MDEVSNPATEIPPAPGLVRRWWTAWLPSIILVGVTIVLVVARSWNRHLAVDVHLWDETLYLSFGVNLLEAGPPTADWSPLYACWYFLESLLVHNRIALYYANWALLMAAVLLSMAFLLRSLRMRTGTVAVALCLTAFLNVLDTPSHSATLATALVLCAAAFAVRDRMALSAGSLALAAFVRPEFELAFVVAILFLAVARRTAGWRSNALTLGGPLALFLVLALLFGFPMGAKSSNTFGQPTDRSLVAFGQHYAWNREASSPTGLDAGRLWSSFLEKDFGQVTSVRAAAIANPRAFVWHVGQNVSKLPSLLGGVIGSRHGMLLGALLFGLALVGAGLVYRSGRGTSLAVVAAALVPQLAAVVLIGAGGYFIEAGVALMMALAATAMDRLPAAGRLAPVAALALLLLVPGRVFGSPWWLGGLRDHAGPTLPNYAFIRSLPPTAVENCPSFGVLESNGGVGVYAGWNSYFILPEVCPHVAMCINQVGAILVDPDFIRIHEQYGDPLLPQILERPSDFGFRVAARPDPTRTVLVRPVLFGPGP